MRGKLFSHRTINILAKRECSALRLRINLLEESSRIIQAEVFKAVQNAAGITLT